MTQMQLRFTPESTALVVKILEGATPDQLTEQEHVAAAVLAAKMRYRAVRLWGVGYGPAEQGKAAG